MIDMRVYSSTHTSPSPCRLPVLGQRSCRGNRARPRTVMRYSSSSQLASEGVSIRRLPENTHDKAKNILEEIIWYKAQEIAEWQQVVPAAALERQLQNAPAVRDFVGALRVHQAERHGTPGLIAEVKKASPSRGILCPDFDPVQIAKEYEAGGASCLSVLTDSKYFKGGFEYLQAVRAAGVSCPLLCKEFIVQPYQVTKARVHGADAILLIAAVLSNSELAGLIAAARAVGLQCLIEVHDEAEMERMLRLPSLEGCMLGINNRDLRTFKVSLEHTRRIMASPPGREAQARGLLVASESGIFTFADVQQAQAAGCGAVLVGESLITQPDRAASVKQLLGP